MTEGLKKILKQQKDWAKQYLKEYCRFKPYTCFLYQNLFRPLDKETEKEFKEGAGDELREKMRALHSSSALAVNVFLYWRNQENRAAIHKALELEGTKYEIIFEKPLKKPNEIRGEPPHLDVVFEPVDIQSGGKEKIVAIESKFTEPYRNGIHKTIKKVYKEKKHVWDGYPKLLSIVQSICTWEDHDKNCKRKRQFYRFDAPQILKHILGLKTAYKDGNFRLLYLWYEIESAEAKRHREELQRFKDELGGSIDFESMTYRELFEALKRACGEKHSEYLEYLRDRYFDI